MNRLLHPGATPICSLCGEEAMVSTLIKREKDIVLCGLCAGRELGALLQRMTAAERDEWFSSFPHVEILQ